MNNNLLTLSLILVAFLFHNNTLTSQDRTLLTKQANTFDIVIGGDLGIRLISGDESLPEVKAIMDRRNEFEDYRLNSRFGINYYLGLGDRLSIKTGIRFANPGFSISSIEEINPEQNINDINKTYQFESKGGFQYEYKYQMIAVPIGIKYTLGRVYCNPYVEVGVSTYFYRKTLVEQSQFIATGNERINKNALLIEEPISKTNYFGFIASGGDFPIGNNLHGFSQIVLRYQFNNLRPESRIEEKMILMGMELGVRYIFEK